MTTTPTHDTVPAGADAATDDGSVTVARTCPLCEAGCGLSVTVRDGEVTRIRGDLLDVFSKGYLCPKGSTLKQLHEDPDRLRQPLVRRDGRLVPATWEEAWQAVADGLGRVIAEHGRAAVGAYVGNPNAHNLGALLYNRALLRALGSPNVFSASTVDQRPKEIATGLMFGNVLTTPVPDLDRTDHLMILGANPFASNGSFATAPDWPGRLRGIVERGGRVVVVDPRRTKTAEEATEHVPVRPGADPYLLAAMVQELFAADLVDLGTVGEYVARIDELAEAIAPFTPEAVASRCGVPADTIRRLAHELAEAPSAAVYARIGTTTSPFGTVTSWLVDVLNTCTGNLDRPGGAMFTTAAAGAANTRGLPRYGRGIRLGRRRSRVRGLPETFGELPVVALAEEIETPGEGQIRAMITVAGNPILSNPDSTRLDAAFASLDFVVAVDIYLNETTRHADVVLPAPSALQKSHYDVALLQLAVRNVANYSPPVLPLDDGQPDEWEILCTLALLLQGVAPADADPAVVDELSIRSLVESAVADEHGPVHGRDVDELLDALAPRTGPERMLDFMLRTGPYGDAFGARPDGLTLSVLEAHPHGIDLGPLQPRMPEALRSPDGMIDLAPEPLLEDLGARLRPGLDDTADGLLLIGRRHLRSNNSWMHNVEVLVKGKPRCTLQVHPDDAARHGLRDGGAAEVRSRTGAVVAPVEVTDSVMAGVVSLPHGWGHDLTGARLSVAAEHAGVNSNVLADTELFDVVSGTAVLNGIPVEVVAADA
ncbi:MAG TPA: molybdopterin-dependent oxidoreductase [Acidimicrobiales bacterium]|nr:molybdopterin-dependent oxidoreductase [Acidimicrobiales bacterium]